VVGEPTTGAQLTPEDGACLMNYVCVLVGDSFGDHPRCTGAGIPPADAAGTTAVVRTAVAAVHALLMPQRDAALRATLAAAIIAASIRQHAIPSLPPARCSSLVDEQAPSSVVHASLTGR
jgi:hypothetical protein